MRILIASCIVSLIKCQQDYYGGESPQPYQAPKVYQKPAQQDSPKPYQAPKVYPSQVGGMGDGDSPRPYGQGYFPQGDLPKPYQAPYSAYQAQPIKESPSWVKRQWTKGNTPRHGSGINHRFQKPSDIKVHTEDWPFPDDPPYPVAEGCREMYDCLAWPFMECTVRINMKEISLTSDMMA